MCTNNPLSTDLDNGGLANSDHFCRIFTLQLNSLYRLAFLLTTNHSLAERCTMASLNEALTANGISQAAAESWSKRAIIRNALRIVRRESFETDLTLQRQGVLQDEFTGWLFKAIISLQLLERFVFVLSVFEKTPDRECSQLLGCAITEVARARVRAFEFLSMFHSPENEQSTPRHSPAVAYNHRSGTGRQH